MRSISVLIFFDLYVLLISQFLRLLRYPTRIASIKIIRFALLRDHMENVFCRHVCLRYDIARIYSEAATGGILLKKMF